MSDSMPGNPVSYLPSSSLVRLTTLLYGSKKLYKLMIQRQVVHLIFSWSAFLSWTLLVIDIAIIALLSLHAYQDADTLDRFEVPFFGGLASSFVDSE